MEAVGASMEVWKLLPHSRKLRRNWFNVPWTYIEAIQAATEGSMRVH